MLVAETLHDVRRQNATVSRCSQRLDELLDRPAAAATVLPDDSLLGAHVDPALDRVARTSANAAFGALVAAKRGLAYYMELYLRALAADVVREAIFSGRMTLDPHKEIRRQLHRMMQGVLPVLRAKFGLPPHSPSGVLSAYAKAGPRSAGFAAEDDGDDDDAALASVATPGFCEPEKLDSVPRARAETDDEDDEDEDEDEETGGGGGLPGSASSPLPSLAELAYEHCIDLVLNVNGGGPEAIVARAEPFVPPACDTLDFYSAHPTGDDEHHGSFGVDLIDEALWSKVAALLQPGGCVASTTFPEFHSTTPLVTGHNVLTLLCPVWLDDEIVNGYAALVRACAGVCTRATVMNSTFWLGCFGANETGCAGTLRDHVVKCSRIRARIGANDTLLDKELIIFPINTSSGTHWVAGCINLRCRRFEVFDSLGSDGKSQCRRMRAVLKILHLELKGKACSLEGWTDVSWTPGIHIPAQDDCFNCGIYMLHTISALARGVPIQLGLSAALRQPSPIIRRRIMCEFLSAKLL